jgi:hypothetical protein
MQYTQHRERKMSVVLNLTVHIRNHQVLGGLQEYENVTLHSCRQCAGIPVTRNAHKSISLIVFVSTFYCKYTSTGAEH